MTRSIPSTSNLNQDLNSNSTPPPPLTTTTSSTTTTTIKPNSDHFLSQTLVIPLTQQDRQEGYDVELLRSQPRGGNGNNNNSSLLPVSNSNSDLVGRTSTSVVNGNNEGRNSYEKVSTGSGVNGMGEKYNNQQNQQQQNQQNQNNTTILRDIDSSTPLSESGNYDNNNNNLKRKKWYMRPLALGVIGLIILVLALGIGLGVGIGMKKREETSSSSSSSTSNSTATSRINTYSTSYISTNTIRNSLITSHATIGTVIPNTAIFTGQSESFTPPPSAPTPNSIPTTTIVVGGIQNPNSNTKLATVGNLPIPEGVSTTIGGVFISAINTSNGNGRRDFLVIETGLPSSNDNNQIRKRMEISLRKSAEEAVIIANRK